MYRVVDGVTTTVMPDGSGVVLDAGAERVFELNEWAVAVWANLESGADRDALVAAAVADFDISAEVVGADIDELLSELQERRLVEVVAPDPTV